MRLLIVLLFLSVILSAGAVGMPVGDTLPAGYNKHFTKQQLIEDVRYLQASMESVHPALYHSISKARYTQLQDSVTATFKDSLTAKEVWPHFAQLVAAIDEGHTMIGNTKETSYDLREGGYLLFPVTIKAFDGEHLLVREDASAERALKTGDHITAINGMAAKKIMQQFVSGYGGLPTWKEQNAVDDFITNLYRFGITAPYQIDFISQNKKGKVVLKGEVYKDLIERLSTIRKVAVDVKPAPYMFERRAHNIGYLNLRTFTTDYNAFDQFLQTTFADIKNKPVKGLIIDLRQNGGGNSALANRLLQFVTDKPYRMSGGVVWKVSQAYKDFIKTKDSAQQAGYASYNQLQNGALIIGAAEAPQKPADNPLRFKGKVCFLIGPNTFSSANMLAATIKDYSLATLIGEPTGEPANDYGEVLRLVLPNTGIAFSTSSKQFVRPNGNKTDNNPILPDVVAKPQRNTNKDVVLEFAIEWMQKGPATATNKK